jgi:agmatinase
MNKTFLPLEPEFTKKETSRYHILPAAYDATSTWQKGADKGPAALLDASLAVELYDIETRSEAFRRGIHVLDVALDFSSPERMVEGVEREISAIFARNAFPILIGGEHSVSVGAAWAAAQIHKKLTVLQLDAHADLRETFRGSAHNHACVMARVREKAPFVQVGIRSAEKQEFEHAVRQTVFLAEDIVASPDWMQRAAALLTEDVYITIDLDVFDPSIMPSTGTPEPGGLGWYPVLKFLRTVIERRNVVGFDVVELCPNGAPHAEFLAAKLVYKLISYHAQKESGQQRVT